MTSWRHNCKTSCKHVLKKSWKTSWRRLEEVLGRHIANTSWRRLQDVFKTFWKTKSVTLKTSSRRLEDVLENKKCLLGHTIQKLQNRRSLSFEEKSSERELHMERCLFFSFPAPRILEPCKISMVYFRLQECLQKCWKFK